MDHIRQSIEAERVLTDASLGAERESAVHIAATESRARRRFIDRIEQDRLGVDERLFKFRDSADKLLVRARLAAASPNSSTSAERRAADVAMRSERETTDAILEQERQRSDDAVVERDRHETERPTPQARQRETDEKLSTERHGVDDAVTAFGDARLALSRAALEKTTAAHVLGMITHELRNPLAVITMNAQLLSEGAIDAAEIHETAEDVVRSAARMTRLLSDLLDGVRIDTGIFQVAPTRNDVCALLREVHASYAPLFEARQLTFDVDLPDSCAPLLAFDHDRIVQVLSNLLSNAMKFGAAGGTVSLHAKWRADCVEFVVRDTGPGIPEEFWQGGAGSRLGLGLGLYICKTIVQAHGGRIWLESTYGHGATFTFTLPMTDPPSSD